MKKMLLFLIAVLGSGILLAGNLTDGILQINKNLDGKTLFNRISQWDNYSQPDSLGIVKNFVNVINDSLKAPYYLYIPEKYDANKRTPLVIYLHGGIGRKNFPQNFDEYIKENQFLEFAKANNWFVLFPNANKKSFWWNLVGMKNISQQIRFVKDNYNLDDNQIFLTGFSDGGSGTFTISLSKPDDFASFYPQNGNILVGCGESNRPIYLPNLRNRFLAAINTNEDTLYPAKDMRKLYSVALDAGANLFYSEYWGMGHCNDYWKEAYPNIINFMKTNPRNIFKSQLYWECDDVEYGKCDWLAITKLDTSAIKQDWQTQYSAELIDERLSFGYFPDRNFSEKGDHVLKVNKNSLAEKMGLKKDDIIIKFDGKNVEKSNDIYKYKSQTSRGEKVTLTVLRNNKEILLKGKFPEAVHYEAFHYGKISGAVKAKYFGNEFDIQTSRVGEICLYINPKMINMEIPVIVNINGREVFHKKIGFDKEFMLKNFMENKDRKALWANKIVLETIAK